VAVPRTQDLWGGGGIPALLRDPWINVIKDYIEFHLDAEVKSFVEYSKVNTLDSDFGYFFVQ
jgi:hypothetical protein